jgi:putative ABC transport system permease protein
MPDWRALLHERIVLPSGAEDRRDEVIEEIAQELDEIYHEAVAGGATDAEATDAAFRELGDVGRLSEGLSILARRPDARPARALPVARDADVKGPRWLAGFPRDLRHGFRMLRWHPGFAAAAIVTMALGIGTNAAVFSLIEGVLVRPLPYRDPAALVQFQLGSPGSSYIGPYYLSGPEFFDYRDRQRSLESFAVYQIDSGNLTSHGEPLRVGVTLASSEFFQVLGVPPIRGRTFGPGEDRPGVGSVAVLRHAFWQNRFGSDPAIVGRPLTIDGAPYTVIGVMPPGFDYPSDRVDAWIPIGIDRAQPGRRVSHSYLAIGRVAPNRSLAQASADVATVARRLTEEFPAAYSREFAWDVHLESLHEILVGGVRRPMLVLAGVVGFVLLIACANVANLLLVRGASREHEIALRVALGAGRWPIVRQLLTESLMLSAAGGVLGLGLAHLSLRGLVALEPASIPRLRELGLNVPALLFTAGLVAFAGLLFGLVPAWRAIPKDLCRSLQDAARASPSARRRRLGQILVVAEVALSLVLLVGAGLLARSFIRLLAVDPGFRTERVLTFNLSTQPPRYARPEQRAALFEQLLPRLRALPGVEAAGAVSELPMAGAGSNNGFLMIEGKPAGDARLRLPWEVVNTGWRVSSPGYFTALRIALLAGRVFRESDAADAAPVVIVDDQFARQAWAGGSPIGKRVATATFDGSVPVWRTVVGVVRHVRERSLARENLPQAYFPLAQRPFGSLFVAIRTAGQMNRLPSLIRHEVKALDPTLPVHDLQTLDARLGRSVAAPRFNAQVVGAFSLLALALGSVGLGSVVAYAVSRRTREIGIRMALGAQRGQVLRLVLWQGVRLIGVGLAVGLAGAWALGRLLSSMLFGISATDPVTYATVAALWFAVAVAACYLPATRAMRVDPIRALRAD